jgi:hypothetical protein
MELNPIKQADIKLPIYNLVVNEDDDTTGVEAVALVDHPAIERNYMAFNEQKPHKFEVMNQEKRILSGPLMMADLPIFRRDTMGEYYVIFNKKTIETISQKYMRNGFLKNVNKMHDPEQKVDGVYLWQSWIIDKANGITAPNYSQQLTDGSWYGIFKVDNENLWNDYIKTGVFKGFSVEGIFEHRYLVDKEKSKIESLAERLQNLRTQAGR